MPDRYIDTKEVSEYGRHFVANIAKFAGLSDIVDVSKLGALVLARVETVEIERQKVSNERSEVRGERTETTDAEETARDAATRFYYYLCSLPKSVPFDFDAFYDGGKLGSIVNLKPADLLNKVASILHGFDNAKNQSVAELANWKVELASAHQSLSDAITGKGLATGGSVVATDALAKARQDFLHAYNKVAKPIVRGLLHSLGREDEMSLLFKDLTVNENPARKAAEQSSEPS